MHFQHLGIRELGQNLCGLDLLGSLGFVSFVINIKGAVSYQDISKMYCLMKRGHWQSAHLHNINSSSRT